MAVQGSLAMNPRIWNMVSAAEGDFQGLVCQGNFPPFAEYLLNPLSNPFIDTYLSPGTYSNLIEVCAQSEWGGRAVNAFAACSQVSPNAHAPIFDMRLTPFRGLEAVDNRLSLYCSTKCRCTGGRSGDFPVQPRVVLPEPTFTQYLSLDKWATAPLQPIYQGMQDSYVGWARINYFYRYGLHNAVSRVEIGGIPRADITCDGAVPFDSFQLPPGAMYDNLKEFCAAEIYGGMARGNMGGFCSYSQRSVRFDSEFASPFLMNNPTLMMYCSYQCWCSDPDPQKPGGQAYSPWTVERTAEGTSVTFTPPPPSADRKSSAFTKSVTMRVRDSNRSQRGGSRRSAVVVLDACNTFDEAGCEWLSDFHDEYWCPYGTNGTDCKFSNLPTAAPVQIRANPSGNVLQQFSKQARKRPYGRQPVADRCGGSCDGPGQCGGSGCRCLVKAALPGMDIRPDHVFQSAGCRPYSLASFALGSLGRRAVQSLILDQACPCNSSYVSQACCDSEDGLVWESKEAKLGVLK